MNRLTHVALASAATFGFFGIAGAQDMAMQGQMGAAKMPDACIAGSASMPDSGAVAPSGNLAEHQSAMMEGMMATSGQMMQGIMADDPDVGFACGMIAHHQAAINMAEAELEYGDDQNMKEVAQTIIDAQSKEIEQLTTWIEENAQ